MFSGKIPFEDLEIHELLPQVQGGERPCLPTDDLSRRRGLTPEMEDLIRDCWTQEPTKRPSADQVVERIQLFRTLFSTRLLRRQVDNPFAILSTKYHEFGLRA